MQFVVLIKSRYYRGVRMIHKTRREIREDVLPVAEIAVLGLIVSDFNKATQSI